MRKESLPEGAAQVETPAQLEVPESAGKTGQLEREVSRYRVFMVTSTARYPKGWSCARRPKPFTMPNLPRCEFFTFESGRKAYRVGVVGSGSMIGDTWETRQEALADAVLRLSRATPGMIAKAIAKNRTLEGRDPAIAQVKSQDGKKPPVTDKKNATEQVEAQK